ncbi:PTS glucitol/sorbitol transporter subunit IIA [Kosakonia sp. MUSA4]|uniref:PTS glucitol/sorbitol transporter subunit IIA n=1 Tax=Kosakonia sp. MUSA4 TaxID=2067958 RepID=UPI00159954CE|nr:PTS glucitol/sorbitol transporter subunit IIA [Kosakonia sp. MUSA4]QJT80274.1 PTS fructose transporter subunit IIA [Kosakonia sp. MUSA4]
MTFPVYRLEVTQVGEFVAQYLQQDKLILFAEPVPTDIAEYCAVHRPGKFNGVLLPGQKVTINSLIYRITAVGSVATANLKQLGHITLHFDGAISAELPGMVHLCGATPATIRPGDQICIYRE